MAAEINRFPFKGLEIEVSTGSETEQAYIKFEEFGVIKEYYIDGFKTSKSGQEVIVFYNKLIKDIASNIYNQDVQQQFDATKQESAEYFYNLPADKLGKKIDVMSINGLLFELKGALCFNPQDGNFYPPISAEFEVEPETYEMVLEQIERPEGSYMVVIPPDTDFNKINDEMNSNWIPEYNKDGSISIFVVDIIGNPTYKIMGTDISNTTGKFTDLSAGTYVIMVSSDAAEMPAFITVGVARKQAEE